MKRLLLTILLATACVVSQAQELLAYRDSVSNGYPFLAFLPDSCATAPEPLPLVVFLHGGSICGTDLSQVTRYGTIDALRRGLELDAIVIAPQATTSWVPEKVMNVIDWALDRFNADPDRVYLLGMSMGGYGTMNTIGTYPDRIAAGMALCGGYSLKSVENLTKVPLWIVHGTSDEKVHWSQSSNVVQSMLRTGKADRLLFDWLVGCNHSVLARPFYMPQTYEWLLSHSLKDRNRPATRGYSITQRMMDTAYDKLDPDKKKALPIRQP